MSKKLIVIALVSSMLALSGCKNIFRAYRIDIPQGQQITSEQIEKIKVGMTPSQVRYVLGTPLMTDTLQPNRWDYTYRFIPGTYAKEKGIDTVENRRVSIYFDLGAVARIETDGELPKTQLPMPASQDPAVRSQQNAQNP